MSDVSDQQIGHRVLVTGATGDIARQVVPWLDARHDLTLLDRDPAGADGMVDERVARLDVVAEPERLAAAMAGHDTVVHLANRPAHRPAPGTLPHDQDQGARIEQLYAVERANVDLMHTVLRTALETGVRRVVAASSNQAAKWYEQPYYQGLRHHVGPSDYPKPVSFYGWAKVAYESLGFLYASGALGRALEVVMLRIVVPRQVRLASFVGQPTARYFRDVAGYISERDLGHLVDRTVVTDDLADEHGVPFVIAYGTSANARRFWDLGTAVRTLGYAPVDNSEVAFAREIRAVIDDGGTTVTRAMVEAADGR